MTKEVPDKEKWEKVFYNFGEETVVRTRQTYQMNENGIEMKYRYVLQILWDRPLTDKADVILHLMPDKESLCEKYKKGILETFGWGKEKWEDINENDMLTEGSAAVEIWRKENVRITTDRKEEETYQEAERTIRAAEITRKEHLDLVWNLEGTTGWDTLQHCINGKPWFKWLKEY